MIELTKNDSSVITLNGDYRIKTYIKTCTNDRILIATVDTDFMYLNHVESFKAGKDRMGNNVLNVLLDM